MKPTLETDAVAETRIVCGRPREIVDAGFARALERERNIAEAVLHAAGLSLGIMERATVESVSPKNLLSHRIRTSMGEAVADEFFCIGRAIPTRHEGIRSPVRVTTHLVELES